MNCTVLCGMPHTAALFTIPVSLIVLFCTTVIDSGAPENGEWTPACSSSFGGWEAHTRGIGSKLLVQMGYEFGKGKGTGWCWGC